MQRREKILLGAFLAILVIWQGQPLVNSLFFKPRTDREDRVQNLETSLSKKKVQEKELDIAAEKMRNWAARSLPPDPMIASALYHKWLIEQANKTLKNAVVNSVKSDTKPKGETYYVITESIKAQGTLDKLCDFLHDFQKSGLLHRVSRINVNSSRHDGNPSLEFTVQVEALAMTASPERKTLFAEGYEKAVKELRIAERKSFEQITKKNLFVRGYNGPPKRETAPPIADRSKTRTAEELFDTAEHVYLVASLTSGEELDAWLYDRSSNKRTILREGSNFEVAGVSGKVLKISGDYVRVEINGETWRLELGKSLRQMTRDAEKKTT